MKKMPRQMLSTTIRQDILQEFRKVCAERGAMMSRVLEAFMKVYMHDPVLASVIMASNGGQVVLPDIAELERNRRKDAEDSLKKCDALIKNFLDTYPDV